MDVNPDKLNAFMGKMVTDLGAAMNASLMLVGDKLGLYKTLAAKGPMNSSELAKATGTAERYVREWLAAQAASGYVEYDTASGKFAMQPEQAMALADEDSPVFMGAAANVVAASFLDEPKIADAFKTGKGVGWHRRSECLFCGTERFFRTGYKHHLVQEWLPALDGVVDKLKRGATVADVGCGHGASTHADGEGISEVALPRLRLSRSLDRVARASGAKEAGVGDRVSFDVATAKTYPGQGLRPRLLLRLPARHGRSRRRDQTCPRNTGARRHLDAGRALRQRPRSRTISTRSGASTTPRRP